MMNKKSLKKILVVDDDKDILVITKYCLEEIPLIDVHYLCSGEDAIKDALSFIPDLILLDVMMPKMDGKATLRALQIIPTLAQTPVVFFTAKVQKEEIESYFKLGVIDVIVKPFNPLTLSKTILSIWDKYQENKLK